MNDAKLKMQNSGGASVLASHPKNSPAMMNVFARIAAERVRQRELMRAGKINLACDSPIVSDDRKLRVLTEALGAVAGAIDRCERATKRGRVFAREDLHDELVHVAAVAVAWLESLEDVAAVCDRRPRRSQSAATENGGPR